MPDPLVFNIFLVFLLPMIAFFLGPDWDRKFFAFWVFCFTLSVSIVGWLIYVVAHFAIKYW